MSLVDLEKMVMLQNDYLFAKSASIQPRCYKGLTSYTMLLPGFFLHSPVFVYNTSAQVVFARDPLMRDHYGSVMRPQILMLMLSEQKLY